MGLFHPRTYLIFLADKDNQELENCNMFVFLSFLHSANFGSGRCNLLDEYLRVSEIINNKITSLKGIHYKLTGMSF